VATCNDAIPFTIPAISVDDMMEILDLKDVEIGNAG
jgi:hypothetical protein